MAIRQTIGSVCNQVKHMTRQTVMLGVGITAVIVGNVRENAGPYTEKLMERGEQASHTLNEAFDQRRLEIRERTRSNGHVPVEEK
ncbi:MAG: hypothetical protein KA773_03655 [Chloroflexi bacterium]|nr:hypothetical protein [Chloroflexota bacterium]